MSWNIETAGPNPSRKSNRQRSKARQRALSGLFGMNGQLAGPMQARLESLEARILMTGPTVGLAAKVSYLVNSNAQPIDTSATVTDTGAVFDGKSFVVSLGSGATSNDSVTIPAGTYSESGNASLSVDADGNITYLPVPNGTSQLVGTFDPTTGNMTNPLAITFDGSAGFHVTPTIVTEVADLIQYTNAATSPPANSVSVTYTATDSNGTGHATTVITVIGMPSISAIGPLNVAENSSKQTIDLTNDIILGTNETSLVLSATSNDNLTVISNPMITVSGGKTSLSFTPISGKVGTAVISLSGQDNNLTFSNLAMITVNVDSTPVITPATSTEFYQISSGFQTVNPSITVTDPSGATFDGGSLVVSGGTANDSLTIPAADYPESGTTSLFVDADGNITYKSAPNATSLLVGTFAPTTGGLTVPFPSSSSPFITAAIVTDVIDLIQFKNTTSTPQDTAADLTFKVTDSNQLSGTAATTIDIVSGPTISAIGSQEVSEDAVTATSSSVSFTLTAGQYETLAGINLSATSNDQALIKNSSISITGTGSARTLTYTPVSGQDETAAITISAKDDNGLVFTFPSFNVTVDLRPTIGSVSPTSIDENTNSTITISNIVPGVYGDGSGTDKTGNIVVTVTGGGLNSLIPTTGIKVTSAYTGGAPGSEVLLVTPATNMSGTQDLTVTVTDNSNPSFPLITTENITITVAQIDIAPMITTTFPVVNNVPTTPPIDQGGTLNFASGQVKVADMDAKPTDMEKLTLTVSSGVLSFTPASATGTGNGTSQVQITDTLANLNLDLATLDYTNTQTTVLSDQLSVKIDDLGHNGTVVDPSNPNATSLTSTQVIAIPFSAVANLVFGKPTIIGEPSLTTPITDNVYLARNALTYTFPVTDNGPSDATNVVFTTTFLLQAQSKGIEFGTVSVAYSDSISRPFLVTTDPNNLNVLKVTLASLPDSVTASITYTVTAGEQGNLTFTDTLSDDQHEPIAPVSMLDPITLKDAGIVSFLPINGTLNIQDNVGIPGQTIPDPDPTDPTQHLIDTPTYTDYPVTVERTIATGPTSLAVNGSATTVYPVTFSLDLAGNAAFGTLADNADYAIVTLIDPKSTSGDTPGNDIVYDGLTNSPPINVTIPDGLSQIQVYIRV